jgi:DNA-binding NarL/FixJ family response regulator
MAAGQPEVTVVLADSHPVIRSGLRAFLGPVDGIVVVAEAATGREAIRQSLSRLPSVLVVDLCLGDISGVTVISEVLRAAPDIGVLVFTTCTDSDSVCSAIRAGARGYLLKSAQQDEMARAIRGVAAGAAVFGPAIAGKVAELLPTSTTRAEYPFPDLTAREREVLDLLAAGVRNAAIAGQLRLAPKTVSNHISAILAKLRVADRAEAITRARHGGLGRATDDDGSKSRAAYRAHRTLPSASSLQATVYDLRPASSA